MSDLERFGINVQSKFGTPFGVYGYPLTEDYYYRLIENKVPFAGERKYIHVFSLSDSTFNITNYSKSNYDKDVSILKKMYGVDEEFIDRCEKEAYRQDYPSYFMNLTRTVAKEDSREWSRVMKNLGYTNLYDNGGGIIHINEREQIVVLDPSIIIHLDIFENKFGGEGKVKSDLNKIKKLMFDSKSMSKTDISDKLKEIYNNINVLDFFKNKEISPSILEFIYDNGSVQWWRQIAEHQNTPQWILNELVSNQNSDDYVLFGLASNKNINNELFEKLLLTNYEQVLKLLFSSSSDENRLFKILNKLMDLDLRYLSEVAEKCAEKNNHEKLKIVLQFSEQLSKSISREIKSSAIVGEADEKTISLIINSLSEHEIDLLEDVASSKSFKGSAVQAFINKCLEYIGGQRKHLIVAMLSDVFQSHGKNISAEQREDVFNALKQIKNK